jgi:hypothetical protein
MLMDQSETRKDKYLNTDVTIGKCSSYIVYTVYNNKNDNTYKYIL